MPTLYYTLSPPRRDCTLRLLVSLTLLLVDRLTSRDAADRRKRERDGEFKRLASAPGMVMTDSFSTSECALKDL
ncbi:hypothetical protein N7519_008639 [Penicillium mononematosum]|uniref:uncharacterized protein n=1 Tax=Penicillium mononematosum TaxID=268346 RepID=UPI002546D43E|nr:uncharacterized protein N7519_008639 [Penicillium mononematosum]KAJ6178178.1 hypothetical protein N7519_008639 [Penicillium mononematosum]